VSVVGVGTDLVDVDRFRRIREQRPRVLLRLFTPAERELAESRRDPARPYAARFAAKEATMKALGVGLGQVRFADIEVVRAESGAPQLIVRGLAAERADTLGVTEWAISLTHEGTMAHAIVIASAS
jgi:holo-[acyl-carrier protein] synthase